MFLQLSGWSERHLWNQLQTVTLPETSIAPENKPSQKKNHLPTIFRGRLLVSERVVGIIMTLPMFAYSSLILWVICGTRFKDLLDKNVWKKNIQYTSGGTSRISFKKNGAFTVLKLLGQGLSRGNDPYFPFNSTCRTQVTNDRPPMPPSVRKFQAFLRCYYPNKAENFSGLGWHCAVG